VSRALLHIEEHLEESSLTLEDMAAVAGFSPHHFHRVFRRVTGEAPKEYVRRLRLERAVYRMKVSPDNVLQIALDSGFASHETFTRAFVRQFDISPSEFRTMLDGYRAAVGDFQESQTFAGFTEETPLTLRFEMDRAQIAVERTPARHLVFVRHHGYEHLLAPGQPFLTLWDQLFAYAAEQRIEYKPDSLVTVTPDDPFVTDDPRTRFDTCVEVNGPLHTTYPVAYRLLPPRLCVVRRHNGGLEEVAKTFAHIGVDWLLCGAYGLAAAPPFEIYTCTRASDGEVHIQYADAYVPLEATEG
jgi:AraC family transcriptional regulator